MPNDDQAVVDLTAAEVRAEVARQQWSQAHLADVLGLSQPNVSLRLRGLRAFSVAELAKLAAAVGKRVSDFIPEPAAASPP